MLAVVMIVVTLILGTQLNDDTPHETKKMEQGEK